MCGELIHCWCNLRRPNGRIARSCFGGTCDRGAGETVLFHEPVPIRLISPERKDRGRECSVDDVGVGCSREASLCAWETRERVQGGLHTSTRRDIMSVLLLKAAPSITREGGRCIFSVLRRFNNSQRCIAAVRALLRKKCFLVKNATHSVRVCRPMVQLDDRFPCETCIKKEHPLQHSSYMKQTTNCSGTGV